MVARRTNTNATKMRINEAVLKPMVGVILKEGIERENWVRWKEGANRGKSERKVISWPRL